jgi:small-conductance mechanosensitive channel
MAGRRAVLQFAAGVLALLSCCGSGAVTAPVEPAVLVFHNREIATLRAPAFGYGPADRMLGARARIEAALQNGGPGRVTLREAPEGRFLEIDGRTVFAIAPGDADAAAGEAPEVAAEAARQRLQDAVAAAHESSDPLALARAAGLAAAATVVWLLLLRALAAVNRRLGLRLSELAARHAQRLKVSGVAALNAGAVTGAARRLVWLAAWALSLFGTYVWLTFVLGRFAWSRPWGEQLREYLLGVLQETGLAIVGAVPGLVMVAVIVLIARWVVAALGAFFDRVAGGEIRMGWLDSETAGPTRRLVSLVVWLFALAMAYPYLPGADSEAFKGLSVLVGLMVSIGASGLVGQAASGLILMYSRTLRTGEFVRIGDTEGTVTELGMFATRVRSGLGEEIVLPNALVLSNTTRNFSRVAGGPGFILHTAVTIGYDTPWRQVHALLLEAARRTRGILAEPAPYVVQTALSDFYVEYKLVAYAGPGAPRLRAEAMSLLHAAIQDVFNEYGVQIMSPQYYEDPAAPKVVPPERWYEAPARPETHPAGAPPGGT